MVIKKHKRATDLSRWLCEQQGVIPQSALRYTLEALVPFTDANLKLSFKPSSFFDELEKIDEEKQYCRATLRQAYYVAKRKGYIGYDDEGRVQITDEARRKIQPFVPIKLQGSQIMVIFDIPEKDRYKRQWFRLLLRELKFEQIQKSVWTSSFECREVLSAGILEQHLEDYVRIYESRPIEQ